MEKIQNVGTKSAFTPNFYWSPILEALLEMEEKKY